MDLQNQNVHGAMGQAGFKENTISQSVQLAVEVVLSARNAGNVKGAVESNALTVAGVARSVIKMTSFWIVVATCMNFVKPYNEYKHYELYLTEYESIQYLTENQGGTNCSYEIYAASGTVIIKK